MKYNFLTEQQMKILYVTHTRSLASNTRHSFITCPFKMFPVHCVPTIVLVNTLNLPHFALNAYSHMYLFSNIFLSV